MDSSVTGTQPATTTSFPLYRHFRLTMLHHDYDTHYELDDKRSCAAYWHMLVTFQLHLRLVFAKLACFFSPESFDERYLDGIFQENGSDHIWIR